MSPKSVYRPQIDSRSALECTILRKLSHGCNEHFLQQASIKTSHSSNCVLSVGVKGTGNWWKVYYNWTKKLTVTTYWIKQIAAGVMSVIHEALSLDFEVTQNILFEAIKLIASVDNFVRKCSFVIIFLKWWEKSVWIIFYKELTRLKIYTLDLNLLDIIFLVCHTQRLSSWWFGNKIKGFGSIQIDCEFKPLRFGIH